VRNQISYVDDLVAQYLTDTNVGSSSSPVVDRTGRLVALHRAGGRPRTVLGEPPVSMNEGYGFRRVVAGMAALVIGPGPA
jgi:hypothetical protein